jgi:hypothetical protein
MQTIKMGFFYIVFFLQLLCILLKFISYLNKIYGKNIVIFIKILKHNNYII